MTYQVVRGDARRIPLADGSVHCCITSPPYLGLRDYGVAGQLGLEKSPDLYVARMVEAFREVRRVLRDDGTLWLNLGDSYAGGAGGRGDIGNVIAGTQTRTTSVGQGRIQRPLAGLKPKDLIGIPWRVAFALQADGWYLRSDIIWHKPNPMPESVTDRPSRAHEYLFLLSKSPTYYYDADAVREPIAESTARDRRDFYSNKPGWSGNPNVHGEKGHPLPLNPLGRNRHTVWTIATKPYKGAHFAVMPPALVRPCILAGTSERGCCPTCGAPWRRVVEREPYRPEVVPAGIRAVDASRGDKTRKLSGAEYNAQARRETLGWEPSCPCPPHDPQPCTVLDPFGGAMTTLVVAEALGRRGVGVELSAKHCARGKRRLDRPHARAEPPDDDEKPLPLFA